LKGRGSLEQRDLRARLERSHSQSGEIEALVQIGLEIEDFRHSGTIQRWRRIQHLANLFWTRWRQEFLPSLQERRKWQQPEANLEVGDVVSVVADDSPRCSWPLGLVTATYPGADGLVRKVRIRIGIKEYDRPVHRLIVLMRRRDSQSGSLGAGV